MRETKYIEKETGGRTTKIKSDMDRKYQSGYREGVR